MYRLELRGCVDCPALITSGISSAHKEDIEITSYHCKLTEEMPFIFGIYSSDKRFHPIPKNINTDIEHEIPDWCPFYKGTKE